MWPDRSEETKSSAVPPDRIEYVPEVRLYSLNEYQIACLIARCDHEPLLLAQKALWLKSRGAQLQIQEQSCDALLWCLRLYRVPTSKEIIVPACAQTVLEVLQYSLSNKPWKSNLNFENVYAARMFVHDARYLHLARVQCSVFRLEGCRSDVLGAQAFALKLERLFRS